jgi:uncharacterized protein (DUF1330 family)
MKFENATTITHEQFKAFFENDHGNAIFMVNLLKYKEKADYPEDHELHGKNLSGAEAYAIYGEEVEKILNGFGGGLTFSGQVERLVLGQIDELWDSVVIATYPSRKHMVDMFMSPEYQAIEVHRNAGLDGQLNIETMTDD